jgi:hypothetical protein
VIADNGASPASGQGTRAYGRQPSVLSIPVSFSPDPEKKADDGDDTGLEQHSSPSTETTTSAAHRSRHTARHRGAPKRRLPSLVQRFGRAYDTARSKPR